MKITIGNHTIDKYTRCNVSLKYDSVASTFSFDVDYNPDDSLHRQLFRPTAIHACAVYSNSGELLITGDCWTEDFSDNATPSLIKINGRSKTGVLSESCVAPDIRKVITPVDKSVGTLRDNYQTKVYDVYAKGALSAAAKLTIKEVTVQFNNETLESIAGKLCAPFGIKVIVDDIVKQECSVDKYQQVTIDADEKIAGFLSKLAAQKYVVLSHDRYGNLLLTKHHTIKIANVVATTGRRTNETPVETTLPGAAPDDRLVDNNTTKKSLYKSVYNFTEDDKNIGWVEMRLNLSMDKMHSIYQVIGEYDSPEQEKAGIENANSDFVMNPYCNKLNVMRKIQRTNKSSNQDPKLTARWLLAQDLKANINMTITMVGWDLPKGKLARPNQIITVKDKDNGLYKPTRFFIEQVDFSGDEKKDTCVLKCVLPVCYNQETPTNIFL